MLNIFDSRPDASDAISLMAQLSARLAAITGDDGRAHFVSQPDTPGLLFLLAKIGDEAVGCAALRPLSESALQRVAEVKRMFAATPGLGIGSALLEALEARARQAHYDALWLETRAINQHAVRFYLRHGYVVRDNYGPYVGRPEAVCFEKILATPR